MDPVRETTGKPRDRGGRSDDLNLSLTEFINSISSHILIVNIDGVILTTNQAAAQALGREAGELTGRTVIAFPEPPLGKALQAAVKQSISAREKRRYQDERSDQVFDVTVNPVIDADGVIACLVVNAVDVTEKKRSVEALLESQAHFQSLMDSAEGFVVYRLAMNENSPKGEADVVFVSPSIKDMMGVSAPLDFRSWYENNHPDDFPRLMEANVRALETGRFDEIMRIYHPTKGEWRWIHAISTGTLTKEGRPTYFNGIILDITDRMRAQESLEKTRAELEARTGKLERLNAALGFLLERRDQERRGFEQGIMENVRVLIKPYLERLRGSGDAREQASLIDIIDRNLDRITSQFAPSLSSDLARLTTTEVRVAALIKDGLSSREIAEAMGVSITTISGHRRNIRAKLGLKSRKRNLCIYLRHLADGPPARRH
jgi:PAS domain S-box-containing protein